MGTPTGANLYYTQNPTVVKSFFRRWPAARLDVRSTRLLPRGRVLQLFVAIGAGAHQDIAFAEDGDDAQVRAGGQLGAQALYVDVHGARVGLVAVFPDIPEQEAPGNHLIGVAGQGFQ